MSVFKRVLLSFTTVLCMSFLLGAIAIYGINSVNDRVTEIKTNSLPSVRAPLEMQGALALFRVQELQHILSNTPEEMKVYEQKMDDELAQYRAAEAAYAPLINDPDEKKLYVEVRNLMEQYLAVHAKVIEFSTKQQNDAALALMRGESVRLREQLNNRLQKIVTLNIAAAERSGRDAKSTYASMRALIVGVFALTVVFGIALAWSFARRLTRQLGGEPVYAADVANQIAAGNLAVSVQLRPGDTSSMLHAMSNMRETLAGMVARIQTSSEAVARASNQIVQGNLNLSSRTEQQAASLEETAASIEELTGTVRQNADNSREASQFAANASEVAVQGGVVVSQVVEMMGAINESSLRIADIIGIIEGISFQTNILALNAAVEAARAGDQGRGFAVVAGEVRSLAQRSAAAAREIKALIDDSVAKVGQGNRLVAEAGATMDEIVSGIRSVTHLMQEITGASHEQSTGIEQVNQTIAQIDQVTQQNAALVTEVSSSAQSMRQQATDLAAAVGAFKLGAARGFSAGC
jgi:methyl-accepting chemotaxis protein